MAACSPSSRTRSTAVRHTSSSPGGSTGPCAVQNHSAACWAAFSGWNSPVLITFAPTAAAASIARWVYSRFASPRLGVDHRPAGDGDRRHGQAHVGRGPRGTPPGARGPGRPAAATRRRGRRGRSPRRPPRAARPPTPAASWSTVDGAVGQRRGELQHRRGDGPGAGGRALERLRRTDHAAPSWCRSWSVLGARSWPRPPVIARRGAGARGGDCAPRRGRRARSCGPAARGLYIIDTAPARHQHDGV